jgi:hypothetical protein
MAFVDEGKDRRWEMTEEQLRRYGIRWYEK